MYFSCLRPKFNDPNCDKDSRLTVGSKRKLQTLLIAFESTNRIYMMEKNASMKGRIKIFTWKPYMPIGKRLKARIIIVKLNEVNRPAFPIRCYLKLGSFENMVFHEISLRLLENSKFETRQISKLLPFGNQIIGVHVGRLKSTPSQFECFLIWKFNSFGTSIKN